MTQVTLYGLTRCSTCVKAKAWLDMHNIGYRFIDYRDNPLPADQLEPWARQLGGWPKLVNRASMTWRQLPDERKNPDADDQWLALIAEFPALIRRPLMVQPSGTVSVGFSEKKYTELLGNS